MRGSPVLNILLNQKKKIGLTKVSGVVSTMEQTLTTLGLEADIIKPLEKKRIKEFIEEDAELKMEDINLNELVNLLYKIENSPMPLKIKNILIKTTFENPDLFIVNLTVSLISRT